MRLRQPLVEVVIQVNVLRRGWWPALLVAACHRGQGGQHFRSPRRSGLAQPETPLALHTPQRAISLSDLAIAFAELGEASARPTSGSSHSSPLNSGTLRDFDVSAGDQAAGLPPKSAVCNATRAVAAPVTVHAEARPRGSQSGGETADGARGATTSPESLVIEAPTGYMTMLRNLSPSQLERELDGVTRRQSHRHIIECLTEVWHRLRLLDRAVITDAEAIGALAAPAYRDMEVQRRASVKPSDSSHIALLPRTDALLANILRALSKVDLDELCEVQLAHCDGGPCHSGPQETPGCAASADAELANWVHSLTEELRWWLNARVAALDVHACISFLHLLSQQRLFFDHNTLETLADTVATQITRVSSFDEISSLMDLMARFQLEVTKTIEPRLLFHSLGPSGPLALPPVRSIASDSPSLSGYRLAHPVLHDDWFHAVTNYCASCFRGPPSGEKSAEGSPPRVRFSLTAASSTSVFFFLRALGKLHAVNVNLISALLPEIASLLRLRPELYFAALVLLGRREVTCTNRNTTLAVINALVHLLEKRRTGAQAAAPLVMVSDAAAVLEDSPHPATTSTRRTPLALVDMKLLPTVLDALQVVVRQTEKNCNDASDVQGMQQISAEHEKLIRLLLDDIATSFGLMGGAAPTEPEALLRHGRTPVARVAAHPGALERLLAHFLASSQSEVAQHLTVRLLVFTLLVRVMTPDTLSKVKLEQARRRWRPLVDLLSRAGYLSVVARRQSSALETSPAMAVEVNVALFTAVPLINAVMLAEKAALSKKVAEREQQRAAEREVQSTVVTTTITVCHGVPRGHPSRRSPRCSAALLQRRSETARVALRDSAVFAKFRKTIGILNVPR